MSKKIFLDSGNLKLIVYVIGYPEMGESQVVILKDDISGVIHYSAVIDCYEYKNINKTNEILQDHNISELNLLCWTHPDDDHSEGMGSLISDFCSANTKVLLPEGIYGSEMDFVDYKPKHLDFFEKLRENNAKRRYNVNSASVIQDEIKGIETIYYVYNLIEFKFRICALAPISAMVRRRFKSGLKNKNDISIALLVSLGELSLFFSGDIENQTINLIAKEHLPEISFLKTPHHTSKSSDALLNIFDEVFENEYKIPFTCSTAYKKFSLPDVDLVNKYKMYSDSFYSTNDDLSVEDFGYFKIEFDPFNNKAEVDVRGSARKIF